MRLANISRTGLVAAALGVVTQSVVAGEFLSWFRSKPTCNDEIRCTTPCEPPCPNCNPPTKNLPPEPPAPPDAPEKGIPPNVPGELRETGVFVAPPRTGTTQGASRRLMIEGFALTFPEIRIGMPRLELPSLIRSRSEAKMILDQAPAPYVRTGYQYTAAASQAGTKSIQPESCEEKLAKLLKRYEELEQTTKELQSELERREKGTPSCVDPSGRIPPIPDPRFYRGSQYPIPPSPDEAWPRQVQPSATYPGIPATYFEPVPQIEYSQRVDGRAYSYGGTVIYVPTALPTGYHGAMDPSNQGYPQFGRSPAQYPIPAQPVSGYSPVIPLPPTE